MSIILAFITQKLAIVLSDGRLHESVPMIDDVTPSRKATIMSDKFDKTFCLNKGKIIGAYCGLLQFDNRTISEHIKELWGDKLNEMNISDAVNVVCKELKKRLDSIHEKDILKAWRKIDMLFVGKDSLTKENVIVRVRFDPSDWSASPQINTERIEKNYNHYAVFGDDSAQARIKNILENLPIHKKNIEFLLEWGRFSIKEGIKSSGIDKRISDNLSCGGDTFVQTIV